MGIIEGGPKASGVAENPGGGPQGVRGGAKSQRATDTPRVEELPQGGKTSGVTLKGNGVPGADGRGHKGDGNPLATRDTKGSGNTIHREKMASKQEAAAPQNLQRDTAEGDRG